MSRNKTQTRGSAQKKKKKKTQTQTRGNFLYSIYKKKEAVKLLVFGKTTLQKLKIVEAQHTGKITLLLLTSLVS